MPKVRKPTQRDIARIAGVSQAAVSLVLNSTVDTLSRIPLETRRRVEKAIDDTGYVANPIARRMVKGSNRILGVFTYEPAFPSGQADFFSGFLVGIEEEVQRRDYDLLLLTGAGRERKIFADASRLRIADGCLVLGREFDRSELARLVAGDYPFVAIGRREDAGGAVPYVGGDYIRATRELVRRAFALGHRRLAYIGPKGPPESVSDRWSGLSIELGGALELSCHVETVGRPAGELLDIILETGSSVAFLIELADAVRLEAAARDRGLRVPEDLSMVVLGSHIRAERSHLAFTAFDIPREEMGRRATAMLVDRIENGSPGEAVLLPCPSIAGETLTTARRPT